MSCELNQPTEFNEERNQRMIYEHLQDKAWGSDSSLAYPAELLAGNQLQFLADGKQTNKAATNEKKGVESDDQQWQIEITSRRTRE